MIKAENITLRFKNKVLYNNFSFHIKANEKVCLQGASGIGKSTLFKILLGYQAIEKGQIWIDGDLLNCQNIKAIRQKIVWIPQKFNMSIDNGSELVALLNLEQKLPQIRELMHILQLDYRLLNNCFHELSEGEKQRLIISICLCRESLIWLLDEPTSALNERLINKLISVVNATTNKTILSISHHEMWQNNADRIILL